MMAREVPGTPAAEPAPDRTSELERLYAKHREFVDAQLAQYAGEPDDLDDLFPPVEPAPEQTRHMIAPGVPCHGCQSCLVPDCEPCAIGESCAEHDPAPDEPLAREDIEPLQEAMRDCLDTFPWEGGPDLWRVVEQLTYAVLDANWRPALAGAGAPTEPAADTQEADRG
jgi:hypothetical protein